MKTDKIEALKILGAKFEPDKPYKFPLYSLGGRKAIDMVWSFSLLAGRKKVRDIRKLSQSKLAHAQFQWINLRSNLSPAL